MRSAHAQAPAEPLYFRADSVFCPAVDARPGPRLTRNTFGFDRALWDPLLLLSVDLGRLFCLPLKRRLLATAQLLGQMGGHAPDAGSELEAERIVFQWTGAAVRDQPVDPERLQRFRQMVAAYMLGQREGRAPTPESFWFNLNLVDPEEGGVATAVRTFIGKLVSSPAVALRVGRDLEQYLAELSRDAGVLLRARLADFSAS